MGEFHDLVKETYLEWRKKKIPMLAAALSFYSLFSIGPLFLVLLFLSGLILKQGIIAVALLRLMESFLGATGTEIVKAFLESTSLHFSKFFSIFGGIVILLAATKVFTQLQRSIDIIWDVEPNIETWDVRIKRKFFSFVIILVLWVLLFFSIILHTFVISFNTFLTDLGDPTLINLISIIFFFIVSVLVTSFIYKYLPEGKVKWSNVLVASMLTSVLFFLGEIIIGVFLINTTIVSGYGLMNSMLVMLLWVYFNAQILLFGAQFSKVYSQK